MARVYYSDRTHIDAVVDSWRDRCLLDDRSLLFEDEHLWVDDLLVRAFHNIAEAPLLDERTFIDKLEQQLEGDRPLVLLGAEILVIYYLFAWSGSIGAATKRARVNQVLGWAGESLDEAGEAWAALGESGIGHPGQYYLLRPDVQLGFLLDFARRLKALPIEERRRLLGSPWELRDFADAGADDAVPGMRHVLLHLLRPDDFERIASGGHKQAIAETYKGLLADEIEDVDEQLLAIRGRLETVLQRPASDLDFYEEPLAGTWGTTQATDGANPVDAIELKRQLVLFGPPGTSKTYEANELAAQIIRRAALRVWGPVAYFERQGRIDEILLSHVRRLQLHPAYSYEEFIRGLRLKDGGVVYEDGYLLRLIDEIDGEQVPADETPLPWVLVLDELNRADLSRVFGEAFSVLEDRGRAVELPGGEPGKPVRTIRLPERLYVIGTMNLIDQSLEQIDFALRRRFLWRRSGFDSVRLAEVLAQRWQEGDSAERYPWARVEEDFQGFVDRATVLNDEIAASGLLGRDYEIGHTYFFDIVGLLARAEHMHRKARASQFLWNRKGEALAPVRDLWRMSIEPLIDQYLQGVDADSRRTALARLEKVFLSGSK
jgi:5-methylcytosine-specific restriction protein B